VLGFWVIVISLLLFGSVCFLYDGYKEDGGSPATSSAWFGAICFGLIVILVAMPARRRLSTPGLVGLTLLVALTLTALATAILAR
jgi:hypothetical protein